MTYRKPLPDIIKTSPGKTICNYLLALLILASANVFATDPINTTFFGNLAIEGYDPVAYFTENKAVEGSRDFKHEWQGATWRFSNRNNLDLFKANPDKYAPQYGGYCAYAVSQNTIAGIDPAQFTIVDGKLYLNYNKKINQTWLAQRDQYIVDADKYWPMILAR